jgi:hypothetical protein
VKPVELQFDSGIFGGAVLDALEKLIEISGSSLESKSPAERTLNGAFEVMTSYSLASSTVQLSSVRCQVLSGL